MRGIEVEDAVVQQLGFREALTVGLGAEEQDQHVARRVPGVGAAVGHEMPEVGGEFGDGGVAAGEQAGRGRGFEGAQDGERPGP